MPSQLTDAGQVEVRRRRRLQAATSAGPRLALADIILFFLPDNNLILFFASVMLLALSKIFLL